MREVKDRAPPCCDVRERSAMWRQRGIHADVKETDPPCCGVRESALLWRQSDRSAMLWRQRGIHHVVTSGSFSALSSKLWSTQCLLTEKCPTIFVNLGCAETGCFWIRTQLCSFVSLWQSCQSLSFDHVHCIIYCILSNGSKCLLFAGGGPQETQVSGSRSGNGSSDGKTQLETSAAQRGQ